MIINDLNGISKKGPNWTKLMKIGSIWTRKQNLRKLWPKIYFKIIFIWKESNKNIIIIVIIIIKLNINNFYNLL